MEGRKEGTTANENGLSLSHFLFSSVLYEAIIIILSSIECELLQLTTG